MTYLVVLGRCILILWSWILCMGCILWMSCILRRWILGRNWTSRKGDWINLHNMSHRNWNETWRSHSLRRWHHGMTWTIASLNKFDSQLDKTFPKIPIIFSSKTSSVIAGSMGAICRRLCLFLAEAWLQARYVLRGVSMALIGMTSEVMDLEGLGIGCEGWLL